MPKDGIVYVNVMAKLILIRHGQSLWNAVNRFTGWVDVPLSDRGRAEATLASCKLRDGGYTIDICFTSMLIRAIETAIGVSVQGGTKEYLVQCINKHP